MTRVVLAGDIGGTKTNLALYALADGPGLVPELEASFPSRDFAGLEEVVRAFLGGRAGGVAAAAFGIAGPVIGDTVVTTNLPWRVEGARLAAALGGVRVRLLNDLEATAHGALVLPPDRLLVLNPGTPRPGHRAVIAAGTGLGQAFLFWDGARHRPVATEGGHADFAPRTPREVALLEFLRRDYGRVSYERVLSGAGLHAIFRFLVEVEGRTAAPEVAARLADEDPAAVVGEAGVAGTCATAAEAVELFATLYGAQAGNLALTVMALGGIYVGGGIVTKLLPVIGRGAFVDAFAAKGRYEEFMRAIPIQVIRDPKAALLGAAQAARALVA